MVEPTQNIQYEGSDLQNFWGTIKGNSKRLLEAFMGVEAPAQDNYTQQPLTVGESVQEILAEREELRQLDWVLYEDLSETGDYEGSFEDFQREMR